MTTPAIVAWMPEASVASQTPIPARKYGTPLWMPPARRMRKRLRKLPAINSGT
jgi:hypothetical protein